MEAKRNVNNGHEELYTFDLSSLPLLQAGLSNVQFLIFVFLLKIATILSICLEHLPTQLHYSFLELWKSFCLKFEYSRFLSKLRFLNFKEIAIFGTGKVLLLSAKSMRGTCRTCTHYFLLLNSDAWVCLWMTMLTSHGFTFELSILDSWHKMAATNVFQKSSFNVLIKVASTHLSS